MKICDNKPTKSVPSKFPKLIGGNIYRLKTGHEVGYYIYSAYDRHLIGLENGAIWSSSSTVYGGLYGPESWADVTDSVCLTINTDNV